MKIITILFTLTLTTFGYEKDYVPRAVLTKDQETEVIALAYEKKSTNPFDPYGRYLFYGYP